MERTEYVLAPVLVEGKSFEELAEKITEMRKQPNQSGMNVTYLTTTTAIAEVYKSYEPTQNGEGKKNG